MVGFAGSFFPNRAYERVLMLFGAINVWNLIFYHNHSIMLNKKIIIKLRPSTCHTVQTVQALEEFACMDLHGSENSVLLVNSDIQWIPYSFHLIFYYSNPIAAAAAQRHGFEWRVSWNLCLCICSG